MRKNPATKTPGKRSLNIPVEARDLARWRRAAKAEGRSLANWVRYVLNKAVLTVAASLLFTVGCMNYMPLSENWDAGTDAMPATDGATPQADMTSTRVDLSNAPDLARSCVNTLSDAGDFTISFRIATTAQVVSTILYQRANCGPPTNLWDVRLAADGTLGIETSADGRYSSLHTTIPVNDGTPHDVLITRVDGTLTAITDGTASGSIGSASPFGLLSALGVASGDPCEATGGDGTQPLDGTVTAVCLSR